MPTITTLREAVGLFHDARVLRNAADTLMLNGFDRADLSILAGEAAIREKLHNAYTTDELEDQPTVPTLAYYGGDSLTELKAATIGGPFFIGAVSASAAIIADNGTLTAALVAALVAGGVAAALGVVAACSCGCAPSMPRMRSAPAESSRRALPSMSMCTMCRTICTTNGGAPARSSTVCSSSLPAPIGRPEART